ncbi:hypothetical protein AVEN_73709-1 [Araneus ventricosus]|uniref:Uncharacterized protein n=1 Tax=Araneus ventricosus TaxID=182803 RepID=A0A4Y2HQN9_ARAVE|nr:hypothetical protein AVEN_73709-1 [Araneus ventricosus]
MFPLCRTCVETIQQATCQHNDEEQSQTGTWISEGLKVAKQKGYQIVEVKDIFLPTSEFAAMEWCYEDNFVSQDTSTNIFIAAFTTC